MVDIQKKEQHDLASNAFSSTNLSPKTSCSSGLMLTETNSVQNSYNSAGNLLAITSDDYK